MPTPRRGGGGAIPPGHPGIRPRLRGPGVAVDERRTISGEGRTFVEDRVEATPRPRPIARARRGRSRRQAVDREAEWVARKRPVARHAAAGARGFDPAPAVASNRPGRGFPARPASRPDPARAARRPGMDSVPRFGRVGRCHRGGGGRRGRSPDPGRPPAAPPHWGLGVPSPATGRRPPRSCRGRGFTGFPGNGPVAPPSND